MKKIITPQARKLAEALSGLGIEVELEHWDGHKHVDILLPESKICIEVDGKQHLTNAHQILTDFDRSDCSTEAGYSTLHVHNDEVDTNLEHIAVAIAEAARIRVAKLHGKSGWVEI